MMYLKGYSITIKEGLETLNLPKWDFGGDKPWTYNIWHNKIDSLLELDNLCYPLIVSDLDDLNKKEHILRDRNELEKWIKTTFG